VSDSTPPPPGGENQPPPPPPPGYGGAPAYGQPAYGPQKSNGKAVWALVLGILGLICCGFIAGIPAIILGKQAQNEIDASGGAQGGRGMATAGFVLGIIACALGVLGVILAATGALNFDFSTS
jgi:hypothetical protein